MRCRIVYGKPIRYYVDDKEVSKKKFDRVCKKKIDILAGATATTIMETSKSWPKQSDGLGVNTKQIPKAEEMFRKLGVPTEFDKTTGKAIVRNNAHQRDILKAIGYHNNDGGYGQITG